MEPLENHLRGRRIVPIHSIFYSVAQPLERGSNNYYSIIQGVSIEQYSDEDILAAADELNGRPRRKLGYRTPEELFEAFLDSVFAA